MLLSFHGVFLFSFLLPSFYGVFVLLLLWSLYLLCALVVFAILSVYIVLLLFVAYFLLGIKMGVYNTLQHSNIFSELSLLLPLLFVADAPTHYLVIRTNLGSEHKIRTDLICGVHRGF